MLLLRLCAILDDTESNRPNVFGCRAASSRFFVYLENIPKDKKRIKFSLRTNDDDKELTKKAAAD